MVKQVLNGKRNFAMVTGDLQYVLLTLPDACVDAAIIDPPGALGFCGKEWDGDMGGRDAWVGKMTSHFKAHSRVVKPGSFVFVWSFPRTSHWTGLAIENAGLEIVDTFFHLFSHRKPSSPDLLKIGAEMWWLCRTPVSGSKTPVSGSVEVGSHWTLKNTPGLDLEVFKIDGSLVRYRYRTYNGRMSSSWCEMDSFRDHFSPVTPRSGSDSQIRERTPKSGSAAKLNVGACLIPAVQRPETGSKPSAGRHPTNIGFSHTEPAGTDCGPGCVVDTLDRMSGQLRSGVGARVKASKSGYKGNAYGKHCRPEGTACVTYGDEGGASRFFSTFWNEPPFVYANRASRKERNEGLPEGVENEGVAVKPLKLMVHLVKLANVPPGGIVLDGFAGTGSTGCACVQLGVRFIGIEKNKGDAAVARRRIAGST